MDDILEAILDLILECSEEVAKSHRVHPVLRVLAGVLLGVFYAGGLGLSACLIVLGVGDSNVLISLVGLLCLGFFGYGGYRLFCKIHRK